MFFLWLSQFNLLRPYNRVTQISRLYDLNIYNIKPKSINLIHKLIFYRNSRFLDDKLLILTVIFQDGEYRMTGNSSKGQGRSTSSDRINSMSPIMNGAVKTMNGGGLPADISKELEKRNIGPR